MRHYVASVEYSYWSQQYVETVFDPSYAFAACGKDGYLPKKVNFGLEDGCALLVGRGERREVQTTKSKESTTTTTTNPVFIKKFGC